MPITTLPKFGVQSMPLPDLPLNHYDVAGKPDVLGRGSTANGSKSWIPKSAAEQATVKKAMDNPTQAHPVDIKGGLGDPRWPASEGWKKYELDVNGATKLHYVYNSGVAHA